MNFEIGQFQGFSRAMFSTWFLHAPSRSLFDCGEGFSTNATSQVFSVENLFLSHGHQDHISGITPFLFIRSSGKGDNSKPLKIFYPKGEQQIEYLKEYIEKLPDLNFELTWVPLEAGAVIERKTSTIQTFATKHHNYPSLGYCFISHKKKLKDQFFGFSGEMLVELKKNGTIIEDVVQVNEFVYTGDTTPVPYPAAKLVFHECTFYNPEDVKWKTHTELSQLEVPDDVQHLVLYHISVRYNVVDVISAIEKRNWRKGLKVTLWFENRTIEVIP